MTDLIKDEEYRDWIVSIKDRLQASQIRAAVAVNDAMLELYWFLGEQIVDRQETAKWKDGFLKQMGKDLSTEFPEIKVFSHRNLRRMRRWFRFWSTPDAIGPQAVAKTESSQKSILQQLVAQIPWGITASCLKS